MDSYNLLVYLSAYIGLFATIFYAVNLFLHTRKGKPKSGGIKTVSIIIPAYNEEKSIEKTIESALSLDYPANKMEIIVVDDGSRDRTYKLAKPFERIKSHTIRVFTKKNGGKGSALNFGIGKSKSEIIVTMDADTFVEKEALKKMIALFYNEKVMSVTPSMALHDARGFWQRIQQVEYHMGVFLRNAFAAMNAVHITPGAFSAYRREFFVKYGGYQEDNITEDLEIALRIQSKNFIIENAPNASVYTIAPKSFRALLVQRRRWYTGLFNNLWSYRGLFGFKNGYLGSVVLPVAVISILTTISFTVYSFVKSLINVKKQIISLSSINFTFNNPIEFNSFVFSNFFYNFFSQPVLVLSLVFLGVLTFYVWFSKRNMKYKKNSIINFFLFLLFYSVLYTFWWMVSLFYVIFNRKVIWRKE